LFKAVTYTFVQIPVPMINVAIVDDHQLFCKALTVYLHSLKNYKVTIVANSGADFIFQLRRNKAALPDIALLDIRMPGLTGIDTAQILQEEFPEIKKIAISSDINTEWVYSMLQAKTLAYVSKETDTDLAIALPVVYSGNYFFNNIVTKQTVKTVEHFIAKSSFLGLSNQQVLLIKLCQTDLPYKSIAALLNMNEYAFEKMRSRLFEKLNITTRAEIVLYGIKTKLCMVN